MIAPHDCQQELRALDLRVTPARLGVLEVLERANTPIDASTVMEYLDTHHVKADYVTVFRILNILTEKGIAKSIQFNEGKLRYEHAGKPEHHHFICEHCGTIEDVQECNVEGLITEVSKKKGFLVKRHSLEFFGLCADCQR